MSLLWLDASIHEGMAWYHGNDKIFKHPVVHSVRNAGFAGYVDSDPDEDEFDDYHDEDGHGSFDENLWDNTYVEPTSAQQRHHDEHDEYPQSYDDARWDAYEKAKEDKKSEDIPDIHDGTLSKFISKQGDNTDLWTKHGTHGPVPLTGKVYATQPHVSQTHIDRYTDDPGDTVQHVQQNGAGPRRYLGNEAPLFVTHEGRLHAVEGHHRVAAALGQGHSSIHGWHYDLDQDPGGVKSTLHDEDDD